MSDQPLPLAEFVVPEPEPDLSPAERYARWIALNGWVLRTIEALAENHKARGAKRLSMKYLVEIVRYEHGKATQGDAFRINNTWTAYLSRDLIAARPDLAPLFETRSVARELVTTRPGAWA